MRLQEAAAQNERKRSAESAQSVLSRLQAARPDSGRAARAPPPRVTELTPAEAAKEEGNAAIKRGDAAQARRGGQHKGRGVGAQLWSSGAARWFGLVCSHLSMHRPLAFRGPREQPSQDGMVSIERG